MWISATIKPRRLKSCPSHKPEVDEVRHAGLLQEGQVARVIDVPLRVEVAVAHFDGEVKAEFWHRQKLYPRGVNVSSLVVCHCKG